MAAKDKSADHEELSNDSVSNNTSKTDRKDNVVGSDSISVADVADSIASDLPDVQQHAIDAHTIEEANKQAAYAQYHLSLIHI